MNKIVDFLNGKYFVWIMFVIACVITAGGFEVAGALIFAAIMVCLLFLSDRFICLLSPLLFMSAFVLKCYDSYNIFIKYAVFIPFVAIAVIFNLVFYRHRRKIYIGPSFWGVVAVAVAVTFGGIFSISKEEYFNAVTLYYVIGLGILMVALYLLLSSSLNSRDTKFIDKTKEVFAEIMYALGVFCVAMILLHYFRDIELKGFLDKIPSPQWSNNISTLIMFAMPFAFLYTKKNMAHLITCVMLFVSLIIVQSRGGILLGSVEFVFCSAYCFFIHKKTYKRVMSLLPLMAVVLMGILFFDKINDRLSVDLNIASLMASPTEARALLIPRSFEDFKAYPIFGRGLGYSGNADLYSPKHGAMHFFHMMIPQIISSMGIMGILAYGFQFVQRMRSAFRIRVTPYRFCLFLSYIGILLMSQVNPGEFCPMPYQLLTMILFLLLDRRRSERYLDPDYKSSHHHHHHRHHRHHDTDEEVTAGEAVADNAGKIITEDIASIPEAQISAKTE